MRMYMRSPASAALAVIGWAAVFGAPTGASVSIWGFSLLAGSGVSGLGAGAAPVRLLSGENLVVAPVSAIPLPAALPLFASALAGFGFFGWRRRRQEAHA